MSLFERTRFFEVRRKRSGSGEEAALGVVLVFFGEMAKRADFLHFEDFEDFEAFGESAASGVPM